MPLSPELHAILPLLHARQFDRAIPKLEALTRNSWTIQDQERQMNWLKWDNAATLKVRDAREVVTARNP